jgi:hypothetical protein
MDRCKPFRPVYVKSGQERSERRKKMKASILTAMMAAVLVLAISSPTWARDPFQQVQSKQIKRIAKGVENGEITNKEHFNLKQEQNRIRRARRQAMADGRLRPGERRRLRQMQEKASEHIYQAKHNRRARYSQCENRYDRGHSRPDGYKVSGAWVLPGWAFSIATGGKW